ncbi:secretory pathway protein Sec39-domain-containing protein [Chaetomium tenue]|uniref:Secretory pathway protein Sec39-domain-containing protein n=1 Tax=Chaetomium tenue TaxID=1854479 RepID=A0ACB7PFC2_9PEZI|nr:secretory pathway protein Sec39-domain-containing protein [Chaetomium globosum]
MALLLSPAKLVLLAVHCAVNSDIDSLTTLAARHGTVLRKDLLLRILLTYLPETLPSSQYAALIGQLESGVFPDTANPDVDCSSVEDLTEDAAAKKVRKLRLLPLASPESPEVSSADGLSLFLLRRSYKVDEEAGLLDELPALLLPFVDHSPSVRTLLVSTILPLLRRNCEYYPQAPVSYTLQGFQQLPDRVAVNLLLAQTGNQEADLPHVGRDLRGLVGPWLSEKRRWKQGTHKAHSPDPSGAGEDLCPGWDELLRWLTTQASRNWQVAVSAVQQWDGPEDADLDGWGSMELSDGQRDYLERSYAQAALASAYLIPDTSLKALDGAYSLIVRVAKLRDLEPVFPLASALAELPSLTGRVPDDIMSAKNMAHLRNNLLAPSNPLTSPIDASVALLQALILSAHILTKAGCPCTIRRAGELALLRDEREQKAEAAKLIHAISNNGPKTDDVFWRKARDEILWLRDWGITSWSPEEPSCGIFAQVKQDFLEVEILRALLANTRYELARSIYDENLGDPLERKLLQDTIYAAAMTAYDNASNPNRTRGGLKKCNDIMKALPTATGASSPQAKQVEALLRATHSLSDYRLVLKQGEPFTPVVLRIHTDPVSIIGKILEQNPKSYTQLHDLVSLGTDMVEAGLTAQSKTPLTPEEEATHRLTAQRRITAMCIDAALKEDDFETAYSYVVNRLPSPTPDHKNNTNNDDDYSWRAALQAGRYRQPPNSPTTNPHATTGLGGLGGSANPAVRHLEQRIECLATALRIAPPSTLQEIANAFRRAEEELDVLAREDDAQADAWDARGEQLRRVRHNHHHPHPHQTVPGAFDDTPAHTHYAPARPGKTAAAAAAAAAEEDAAPMSLFDLSRASVLSAQRNLSALSGLQRSATAGLGRLAGGGGGGGAHSGGRSRGAGAAAGITSPPSLSGGDDNASNNGGRGSMDIRRPLSAAGSVASVGSGVEGGGDGRVRKRDQLREAAMGTLVSGVGWLVGAPGPAAGAGQGAGSG